MIAFFQTGGIGDALMGTAVIRRLARIYGDVGVLYFNPLVPQVLDGLDGVAWTRHLPAHMCRTMENVKDAVPECDMVVFNKFRRDHDNRLNFFIPFGKRYEAESVGYRDRYLAALCEETGKYRPSLEDFNSDWLIRKFNAETDYFSDWRRYGLDISYDEVGVPLEDLSERHPKAADLEDFAIIHDSKFPNVEGESVYLMKTWFAQRWADVARRIRDELGLKVVQIGSNGQLLFGSVPQKHSDLIGGGAKFKDYLWLLSRCKLYVGTDSWPAHAAIFVRDPKYVLLKGAVSMRWDHGGRYSRILRKGGCQACEGPSVCARGCVWMGGSQQCMDLITVDDVVEAAKEELCK